MFKKCKIFLFLMLFFLFPNIVLADDNLVNIYFFHSDSCTHCQDEVELLEELEEKYSNIKIYKYEVHNEENNNLMIKVKEYYGVTSNGVPFTIIGDKYYLGFSDSNSKLVFIKTIEYYSRYGYKDNTAEIVGNDDLPDKEIDDNQISLDSFIESYENYQLVGDLYTDDLELDLNVTILSILSELNIFNVLCLFVLVYMIIYRLKTMSDKFIGLIIYIIFYLVMHLFFLINSKILFIIMGCIYLILLVYIFRKYYKDKSKIIIYYLIFILGVISNLFKFLVLDKYMNILNNIIRINNLSVFEVIIKYLNSCITVMFITALLVYIIYMLDKLVIKVKDKYIRKY